MTLIYRSKDGSAVFRFRFAPDGGRIGVWCLAHPPLDGCDPDPHKTHMFPSGRLCFAEGRAPRDQRRAKNSRSNGRNTFLSTGAPDVLSVDSSHRGIHRKNMTKNTTIRNSASPPPIWMSHHVLCQIMNTVGARRPETGGILLGPVGSNHITAFYFDGTASCSQATYTPDHLTLRRMMQEVWLPAGVDMKGFVHSHPGSFDRLSEGDQAYIRRLLAKNDDMSVFAAPIVIPHTFRLRPIVVLSKQPTVQRPTTLRLF